MGVGLRILPYTLEGVVFLQSHGKGIWTGVVGDRPHLQKIAPVIRVHLWRQSVRFLSKDA
jgi:hypothetical protein